MKSGQILQFPLARGLDGDSNPKRKPVSTLKTGENIRWPRDGVIGKRFGAAELAPPPGAPLRFITRGPELSVTDGQRLYTYNPDADSWIDASDVGEVAIDWNTLIDDSAGVATTDLATSGDLLIHAWVTGDPTRQPEATPVPTTSGHAFVQVTNGRSGQTLMQPRKVGGSGVQHLRVLVAGGYAFVIFSAGANIKVQTFSVVDFSWGNETTLRSDRYTTVSGRFDATVLSSGSFALVYERDQSSSSSLAAVRFTRLADALSQAALVDLTDGTFVRAKALAIAESTTEGRIYLAYAHEYSNPTHRVRLRAVNSSTMASAASAVTVEDEYFASQIALRVLANNQILCAWSGMKQASVNLPSLISEVFSGTSAVSNTRRRTMTAGLLSCLFTLGSADRTYAYVADSLEEESPFGSYNARMTFPSSFLLEVEHDDYGSGLAGPPPHRCVGKIDNDISGIIQIGLLPHAVANDGYVFAAVPYQADAGQESFNWRCGLRLVRVTVDHELMADQWRTITIGQESYIASGQLGAWDGRSVFGYGMRTPLILGVQDNGANTGSMMAGTYIYQFGAGYRSRAGVLHRGPLSVTATVPIEANGSSVDLSVASHGIDGKQTLELGFGAEGVGAAFVDVYRTEANGSVLHKLTYEPRYNVAMNDPTQASVDLTDTRWDADITADFEGADDPPVNFVTLLSRPQPYTASGELEDVQPPAQYTMMLHNGRIVIVTGGRREIWFSKDIRENPGIAPGFNDAQRELYSEEISALAILDDKRIVFHERGLWYVAGDGPNVTGLDNRFSAPISIQSDVGCTNPRSVVSWPGGVIFQSGADLYNLSRELGVSWIGKAARDVLAAYPRITSAVLVAEEGEIRLTCNAAAAGEGAAGIMLVFDYTRGTWMTRTYEALEGAAIQDAVLHEGVYYLTGGGHVLYEDITTHLDRIGTGEDVVDTFVESTAELEPIAPAGSIGWQRVRVAKMLGQSLSNHMLMMSAARDWSDTYEQNEVFDAGSDVTTPDAHQRLELALTVQRRQAVQLKFSDAAPANTTTHPLGNGAGFQLEGVALLVQSKPGLPPDTPSRRGG